MKKNDKRDSKENCRAELSPGCAWFIFLEQGSWLPPSRLFWIIAFGICNKPLMICVSCCKFANRWDWQISFINGNENNDYRVITNAIFSRLDSDILVNIFLIRRIGYL